MRDYFGTCFADGVRRPGRGVDVGAGANLYPALSMLPWCEKVLLLEYAQPNVEYLEKQASPAGFDTVWDPFWDQLREHPAYAAVEPRGRFGEIVRVERANLLDLDGQRRWDIGTMFFVADSMSECPEEFRRGVTCFMGALNEGAPFATAFMKESVGYQVGDPSLSGLPGQRGAGPRKPRRLGRRPRDPRSAPHGARGARRHHSRPGTAEFGDCGHVGTGTMSAHGLYEG